MRSGKKTFPSFLNFFRPLFFTFSHICRKAVFVDDMGSVSKCNEHLRLCAHRWRNEDLDQDIRVFSSTFFFGEKRKSLLFLIPVIKTNGWSSFFSQILSETFVIL